MERVRLAIIGCGSVSRSYFSRIDPLRKEGRVEIAFACDQEESRREWVQNQWGVSRFTTDYRQVLEAEDVDLVVILTPMPLHGPMTKEALQAGKHVLVEKPMAVRLEEAQEILDLARRGPGYLLCAPFVLLSPTFPKIYQRIRQGDIGKVFLARARYGWSGPNWGKWFYQAGGGVLFDLGVYNITSLTGLLGPVRRVMAMTGIAIPEREVEGEILQVEEEDNAQVLLDFGEAVFGVVTTGFTIQNYKGPAIELYGSEGTLHLLGDDWAPRGYEIWRKATGEWETFPESDTSWHWADGIRHLVDCIQYNQPPKITPEHAYHVLEIMIRAKESGKDGRVKEVESTFTHRLEG